jgi:hypothetical protein
MPKIVEAVDYYVPKECRTLLRIAKLTIQTLRDLGHHDLADAEMPRLWELYLRSGSSSRLVIITSEGFCHTRITQPCRDLYGFGAGFLPRPPRWTNPARRRDA